MKVSTHFPQEECWTGIVAERPVSRDLALSIRLALLNS
jgi:hypothetical protein